MHKQALGNAAAGFGALRLHAEEEKSHCTGTLQNGKKAGSALIYYVKSKCFSPICPRLMKTISLRFCVMVLMVLTGES